MTVTSAIRKAGPFAGNNTATTFPFNFKVFTKGDVKVLLVNPNGLATQLTLDSNYSVQLNTDQNSNPGGWVTYPINGSSASPLAPSYELVMLGDLAYDQETDITNTGGFYPQTIEDMSDRSTIQIQQLAEVASRAIVISESESISPVLPTAQSRANSILGFDAIGNVELYPLTPAIGAGDLKAEIFIGGIDYVAGTSTALTLSRAYGAPANVQVHFDGVYQGTDQYSLNGTQITFGAPIPVGTNKVYIVGGTTLSIYVPPSQSVGDTQLAWGNVLGRLCDSVAALSSLNVAVYTRAFVTGYYAPGDGGGGAYYYSALSTATVNGGTVLAAAGGAGRWLLLQRATVSLKQFGAKGDGVTDDTAAITSAFNSVLDVFVDPGLYQHTDITVTNRSSLKIRGAGGLYNSQFRGAVGGFGFSFVGSSNVEIHDCTFTAVAGVLGTGGVQIDQNSSIRVYDCLFYSFTGPGLQMNGALATQISGCIVQRCMFLSCGTDGVSPQFYAVYSNDFTYTDNQFGANSPFTSSNRPAIGVHFTSCSNGYFADNLIWECGKGMVMDNACQYNRIIGNRFEQSQQQGLWVIGGKNNIFSNNWINNNSLAGSGLYDNCIFDSSTHNIISGNQSFDWDGPGHISLTSYKFQNYSTDNTFTANKAQYASAYVAVDGTSINNTWDKSFTFSSGGSTLPAATTAYLTPGGYSAASVSPAINSGKSVAVSLLLQLSNAPGAGQSVTGTLFVNGAATGLTALVTGASFSTISAQQINLNDQDSYEIQISSSGGASGTYVRALVGMTSI